MEATVDTADMAGDNWKKSLLRQRRGLPLVVGPTPRTSVRGDVVLLLSADLAQVTVAGLQLVDVSRVADDLVDGDPLGLVGDGIAQGARPLSSLAVVQPIQICAHTTAL